MGQGYSILFIISVCSLQLQKIYNEMIKLIKQIFHLYNHNPSMKSKKIVYFDQNYAEQRGHARKQSVSKKNLSAAKALRQASANKSKNISQTGRLSGVDKLSSNQKIKIVLTKDSFIFEKKYMIYDIQCILIKKQSQLIQKSNNQNQQNPDQQFLLLNLQTSCFGVTKGTVRHNFPVQRDNSTYIEVRAIGYIVQNMLISNKKIEYVNIQNAEPIDQQQITLIQPIKLIQESQSIRQEKIAHFYQRQNLDKRASLVYKFCWNLEPNVENAESMLKQNHKKMQVECSFLNSSLNSSMQVQINRQNSKNKKMINNNLDGGNKTNRESVQKLNLVEFMKPGKQKQVQGKPKTGSRKLLNDSGLSYNGNSKNIGKENKKQDAYGLQQVGKRSRNKTIQSVQNQQTKRVVQILDMSDTDMESNRYGITKKAM